MRPQILVIIPAFNESGIIGKVIQEVFGVIDKNSCEILVIDDGSTDSTGTEARAAGARVISQIQNLGYGYSLMTGYQVANEEAFSIVVQMDGDGQHAAQSIPELLHSIRSGESDLVIGSRALSDTVYPMPLPRRLGQRLFSWLLFIMGGIHIRDATSGFQVIGPAALKEIMVADFPGDYPDTNILLHLALRGIRISEKAAEFRVNTRGKSMHNGVLKPIYYVYSMALSMGMIYWRNRITRRRTTHK